MKKEKWNPLDWQGRTQQQVESNSKMMGYSFVILAGMGLGYGLVKLIVYVLG